MFLTKKYRCYFSALELDIIVQAAERESPREGGAEQKCEASSYVVSGIGTTSSLKLSLLQRQTQR